jgi:hypothetical protein
MVFPEGLVRREQHRQRDCQRTFSSSGRQCLAERRATCVQKVDQVLAGFALLDQLPGVLDLLGGKLQFNWNIPQVPKNSRFGVNVRVHIGGREADLRCGHLFQGQITLDIPLKDIFGFRRWLKPLHAHAGKRVLNFSFALYPRLMEGCYGHLDKPLKYLSILSINGSPGELSK